MEGKGFPLEVLVKSFRLMKSLFWKRGDKLVKMMNGKVGNVFAGY